MTGPRIPEQGGPGTPIYSEIEAGIPPAQRRADMLVKAAAAHLPWLAAILEQSVPAEPRRLAEALIDLDETPIALHALAAAYVERSLYRANAPRARTGDPETSQAAAEQQRGPARPGGKVHKILAAYAEHARLYPREGGLTAREVESRAGVRTAHKRTSELLHDGLLVVVTRRDKAAAEEQADRDAWLQNGRRGNEPTAFAMPENPDDPATRGGGRLLRITDDGRRELARLNEAAQARREREEGKARRRRKS